MKALFVCASLLLYISCSDNPETEQANTNETESEKLIPGVEAAGIHENFTNKGFALDKKITAESCTYTCKRNDDGKDYAVVIWGPSPTKINQVGGTVMFEKSDETARQFIGYVASVPYAGSNTTAATAWALEHFEAGGDTTIGKVRFHLTAATQTARVLKLFGQ